MKSGRVKQIRFIRSGIRPISPDSKKAKWASKKAKTKVGSEEFTYLCDSIIYAPQGSYYCVDVKMKVDNHLSTVTSVFVSADGKDVREGHYHQEDNEIEF